MARCLYQGQIHAGYLDGLKNQNRHKKEQKMKKITFEGVSTRYQMKKLTEIPRENVARKGSIGKEEKDIDEQREMLHSSSLDEFDCEIHVKMNGYKSQDERKNIHTLLFISKIELLSKLRESNLHCFYCNCDVYILYKTIRQENQWTLDRIDNSIGHTNDNVVISCLKCNLEKKRSSVDKFKFTKQLKISKV